MQGVPGRADFGLGLFSGAGVVGLGVFVGVGVLVAPGLGLFVGIGVFVAPGLGVFVAVGVLVALGVGVFVAVGVLVALGVGVFVAVGVLVALGVGVCVPQSSSCREPSWTKTPSPMSQPCNISRAPTIVVCRSTRITARTRTRARALKRRFLTILYIPMLYS